jgi:nucleoside-diphosphate-sugar epimerase
MPRTSRNHPACELLWRFDPQYPGAVKALVIGGSGFIGPFVVEQLVERGHEVIVFHRGTREPRFPPAVRRLLGDRRKLLDHRAVLRACAPDVVIDVILSSGAQARDLMQTFRRATSRVVALSSMDVYRACGVLHGSEPGPLEPVPLTEYSPLRTTAQTYPAEQVAKLQQVFGWLDADYDKIPVEQAVLGDPELEGRVLRLPMVYGPGDPLHRFRAMLQPMDSGARAIPFEESVARWRSPRGYVENVAAAIVLTAEADQAPSRVYNVGEAESFSELEWARQIATVVDWPGQFVVLPADRAPDHLRIRGNLEQHWVVDTTRIRQELGYHEPVEREEAIRRTIAWERNG